MNNMLRRTRGRGVLLVFGFIFGFSNYSYAGAEGLVARWKFDEGSGQVAYDASGNNNHGKIHGAKYVKCGDGYALQFDGLTDYVDCGNDKSLNVESITIELWIKFNSFTGPYDTPISKGNAEGSLSLSKSYDESFKFYFGIGSPHRVGLSLGVPSLDTWYHWVGTYNAADGVGKAYVNGVIADTQAAAPGPLPPSTNAMEIGRCSVSSPQSGERYFNGTIDEVVIYNRALTEAEIKNNYERGKRSLPFAIVLDNTPGCVIALPDIASKHEQVAAQELQKYIALSTGVKLGIVAESKVEGLAIFVGLTGLAKSLELVPDQKLGRDGYILKLVDQGLILAGNEGLAHRYAVYDFLYRVLGCRWYIPTELFQYVPKRKTLVVSQLDRRDAPAFDIRNYKYIWQGQTHSYVGDRDPVTGNAIWATRNRLTTDQHRTREFGHAFWTLIPQSKYYEKHPEYYPLINGQRYKQKNYFDWAWQPCTSNPDVIRLCVEAARCFFDHHKTALAFTLGINDANGWCECERCRALDHGAPARHGAVMSYRYYTFVNQVAREVAKTHPGRFISCLAYLQVSSPPDFDLEPNVMVQITLDCSKDHEPAYQKEDHDLLTRWTRVCKHMVKYDYWGIGWVTPRYYPAQIAQDLRFLQQIGIRDYRTEECPTWGLTGPMLWIGARLFWSPDEDWQKLQNEFCQDMFGAAGPTMNKYFSLLQAMWSRQKQGTSNWLFAMGNVRYQLWVYTPADVAQLGKLIAEARKQADSDLARERVDFFARAWRMSALYAEERDLLNKLGDPDNMQKAQPDNMQKALEQARLIAQIEKQVDQRHVYGKEIEANGLLGGTFKEGRQYNDAPWEKYVRAMQRITSAQIVAALVRAAAASQDKEAFWNQVEPELRETPLALVPAGIRALDLPNAGSKNIVKNPDFEQKGEPRPLEGALADWEHKGAPSEWNTWYDKKTPASFAWQQGEAHSGDFCVRLQGCKNESWFIHKVAVEAGRTYALRVFARTNRPEHSKNTQVRLRWQDKNHAWIAPVWPDPGIFVALPEAKPGWQPIETVFRVPEGAHYAVLLLTAENQDENEASWYDDVLLIPVSE